jgi:hypothetical protein
MFAVFVPNNLKVDPFHLRDQPVPGFDLLTWDHQSYVFGTLWDIDGDAGISEVGIDRVYGQVWTYDHGDQLKVLYEYFGAPKISYPVVRKVYIEDKDDLINEKISATIFLLSKILPQYTMIRDGRWSLKRE